MKIFVHASIGNLNILYHIIGNAGNAKISNWMRIEYGYPKSIMYNV